MQFTFHLHRPLNEVFAYLTTPELFTTAHPLIERMVPLGDGRYRVHV